MLTRHLFATALSLACAAVWAADPAVTTVQRDVNQQTRIERGLKDGSLSVQEAGRLERRQAHIDRLQARSLKDGEVSAAERARLDAAQDRSSAAIAASRHNAVTGDPDSAASQRMQGAVERNANQERRIASGLKSGALTNHEAARLERGQAHVARREARAAADGHVRAGEAARIDRTEDRQSRRIYRQKHDRQTRG